MGMSLRSVGVQTGVWSPLCHCCWGVLQCTRRSPAVWEPVCGTQPGFMAADGSGAAAQLTGGCGVPGSQGPTRVPPVQGRWALSPGPVLPGDIHLPSMTGCWKVPLPHQALLYKRSRAEVMLPVLLPHLTLRALPEPTIPTGHAMAAGVQDIEDPSRPRLLVLPDSCGVGRDQAAHARSGMGAGEKGGRVPLSECLFLPFHPKPRPTGSLDGAASRSWGTWAMALGGLPGLGVSSCVRSCSAVTVQEPSVAGTQCCGQSCYRGPLDVPRAVVALWLSPGGAFPQPLPVYDDACGFPACRGSWQCPWDSLPLGPCHSTWGSHTLPRVLVYPSPGEALVPR